MSVDRFLRAMPKVELHCHLDGSLRVETILDLARRQKVKLPAGTVEGLRPHVTAGPSCRSLRECLDVFLLLYPLLRDPVSVERAAYELVEDCAAENIRHVEVRDAPALHARAGFSAEDFIEAALRGLSRGRRDFGVTSGFIVILFRALSPKENQKSFDALKRFFGPYGTVGMDLAGDEAQFPTAKFSGFYEQANRLGIPTTCHAGETAGTESLRTALDLEVRRIGHGIRLLDDEGLLREVVRRRIPLEIGLTSNVRTKSVPDLGSHPALRFHRAGAPISLNTDDRGIFGIDLTHEYRAGLDLGFSVSDLSGIALASVDQLFLSEAERQRLKAAFATELTAPGDPIRPWDGRKRKEPAVP